ncbi:MAG: cytochrome C [Betaproteobacteria bacterium HGW-Betaproteobacteria-13]|jgi:cytochrome c556|uniref:Cytochrome C n=1 Tax=Parazoarcus communis TaxID=41977 RepID=A0A2U8H2A1_9RHOO|nr:cytochrome c [Parazoarcus communis]AWI79306.1 cytochrome C [Parazoarcus communis]PKO81963.1 MAG: cytochrome C [Betaproteobacteria bacterium HGW-Betaproteobacteria-13]
MLRLFVSSLFMVLALAACNQQVEDTGPGQPVKHRQDAFKAMLRAFEPMGVMLRDKQYDAGKFAELSADLVARREAPWAYFTADTLYPPTKAKAAVWERADEFERERQTFFDATDALLAAAQTRELEQVGPAYEKVYDSCKSCHNDFKKK